MKRSFRAVREKYTAAAVSFGMVGQRRPMPRGQYLDEEVYPISPMDWDFATTESVKFFDSKSDA